MIAKRDIIPIFVPHLGCPNDCVFCNQRKISGNQKPPDTQELCSTIEQALARIPGKNNIQLAFFGGSFTAIPPEEQMRLLEGALPFFRDGRISSLRVSTRPDCIDEEGLKRLKNYGVKTIELGAQSMSEDVLRMSGRGHTAKDTETAAKIIKEAGFELILQMMTGLPGDSLEKTMETAKRLISLEPNGVRIYPTVIIKDTALETLWRDGRYAEHTVEEAADWCAKLLPMFEQADVPVIRLGLNPSDDLTGGEALAGAYHPAFGQIVLSKLLREKASALLENLNHGKNVVLGVHTSDVSAMVGQKKANIIWLKERFLLDRIRVQAGNVKKGEVIVI